MMKWKCEDVLNKCKNTLMQAYLATMHSKNITVIYSVEDKLYYHELNDEEVNEISRLKPHSIALQAISKKRIKAYEAEAVEMGEVSELEGLKADFPEMNNGWLAEFLYRMKITGEAVEDIKYKNNSRGYDVASDTTDDRQIKFINSGATFTDFDYLVEACKRKSYEKLDEVIEAVKTITELYNK